MWNSIIVASGYRNGGLQSGPGPHINLPRALPRSQTYDVSHIPEGDPMVFTTLFGFAASGCRALPGLPATEVLCTTKLAQHR